MKRVLTGQQTGLLGGPLYTTFKVLTAIRIAEESKGEAVYWLETNDADFREISVIDYINSTGELKSLRWQFDTNGASTGYIKVNRDLVDIINCFFDDISQTEYTADLRKTALECYSEGRTLEQASLKLAERLFRGFDVKLFTPFNEDFRKRSRRILLDEALRTEPGDQCNMFILDGTVRRSVFRDSEGFITRNGERIEPENYPLLPNVKTRNLCQDDYFGASVYVGGPGELKYTKELAPWYDYHSVKAAEVVPRMSLTFLEPKTLRLLKKLNKRPDQMSEYRRETVGKSILREVSDRDPAEVYKKAKETGDIWLDELGSIGIDRKRAERVITDMLKSETGRMRKEMKEKHSGLVKAAESVYDMLRPFDKPQERVFNIFYYMNRYGGIEFIKWLYKNYNEAEYMEVSGG